MCGHCVKSQDVVESKSHEFTADISRLLLLKKSFKRWSTRITIDRLHL